MNKVTITWRNINPFSPNPDQFGKQRTGNIPEEYKFEDIEQFAQTTTPDGYYLYSIAMNNNVHLYIRNIKKHITIVNDTTRHH